LSALRRSDVSDGKAVHSRKFALLADGRNSAAWAVNLRSEDFELLCPDGRRAPVDQYSQCHLAQVPPHMVSADRKDNYSVSRLVPKQTVCYRGPEMFVLQDHHQEIPY
jgi:hypothetical protein